MKAIKKLAALAVVLIFLLSLLPAALAEKGNSGPKGNSEPGPELSEEPASNEEAEETAKETQPIKPLVQAQKQIQQVKKQLSKAQERFQLAREKYQEAKIKFSEAKENVLKFRDEVRECKEEEDCTLKQSQFRRHTRNYLLHLSDMILGNLEKLKEKISDSELADREELLAGLEQKIAEVTAAKENLAATTEELTSEEIKDSVMAIKEAWGKAKPKIKLGSEKLIHAKLGNIMVKIEQLEAKFQKIRDRLAAEGKETAALDAYLAGLNQKTASAKENWEWAQQKFQEAKEAENPQPLIDEAHDYQKAAQQQIKEAKADIRNIVNEIKEQKIALDDQEETTGENEAEDESEGEAEELESEDGVEDEDGENEE